MGLEQKQKAIAIMPKFSAFLSILGSGFIIYDILCSHFNQPLDWFKKKKSEDDALVSSSGFSRSGQMNSAKGRSSRRFGERKTLKNSAYYRLMLAMSTTDFIVSFAWFCTTWPIPKDSNSLDNPSEWLFGNIGNMQTCTAQAFFIQIGIITPFYNALLSCYYYLTIRREWKEEDFKKKVEYIGHFVSISFGVGTSVSGLIMELYNNSNVWCWIAPYPSGCGDGEGQTPCERGINAKNLRWTFYYGPLWVMIFLVAFFMILVYMYVRGLDVKMNQYTSTYRKNAARNTAETESSMDLSSATGAGKEQRRSSFLSRQLSTVKLETIQEQRKQRKNERSKAVANQGLFYAGTFALVWIFGTIVRAMQLAGAKPPWPIIFLFAIFTPSQGFFNFLVYIRPRVIKHFAVKKKRKSRSNNESFNSNHLHVSGMSRGSATSSVDKGNRDTSSRSEVVITDPFMSSAPEGPSETATTSDPSTVKTKAETSSNDGTSE